KAHRAVGVGEDQLLNDLAGRAADRQRQRRRLHLDAQLAGRDFLRDGQFPAAQLELGLLRDKDRGRGGGPRLPFLVQRRQDNLHGVVAHGADGQLRTRAAVTDLLSASYPGGEQAPRQGRADGQPRTKYSRHEGPPLWYLRRNAPCPGVAAAGRAPGGALLLRPRLLCPGLEVEDGGGDRQPAALDEVLVHGHHAAA